MLTFINIQKKQQNTILFIPTEYFSFKYGGIGVYIDYMLENMKLFADFPPHFSTGVSQSS